MATITQATTRRPLVSLKLLALALLGLLVAAAAGIGGANAAGLVSWWPAGGSASAPGSSVELARVRIPFIENQGQLDPMVRFYAATFAGTVYVTQEGLTYALGGGAPREGPPLHPANSLSQAEALQGVAIQERFLTQQPTFPTAHERSNTVVSYFVGEKESWRSNVPTFNAVSFGEVWPSVDVELRAYGKNVEKVFTVWPGGRVEDIRLAFDGVSGLAVGEGGELLVDTDPSLEGGAVAMARPVAYQEIDGLRSPVEASYQVEGSSYGFAVGDYNPHHALVIDPQLTSTFLGGGAIRIWVAASPWTAPAPYL